MICFRDMTFCASPDCKGECGRQWTPELAAQAERWWNPKDDPAKRGGALVAFSFFCGGENLEQDVKEKRKCP